MKRYRLLKEYPGHKIGDIAIYDDEEARMIWKDFPFHYLTFEAFPHQCPDWWQEIVEEKSLEDYEKQFYLPISKPSFESFKKDYPRIYWTEVLRVIAADLNSKSKLADYHKHSIGIYSGFDIKIYPSSITYNTPGVIYFNTYKDCQKAIDLLGDNIKHLFND